MFVLAALYFYITAPYASVGRDWIFCSVGAWVQTLVWEVLKMIASANEVSSAADWRVNLDR